MRARGLLSIPAAPPTPAGAARGGAALAARRSRPADPRRRRTRCRDAARGQGAPPRSRRGWAGPSRPVSVGFALSGPGGKVVASRAYEGIAGGEGEWVRVHRRGGRGPGHLHPAPRRGGRRGPARQRRAHGQGRARLGRRARDLGPRARAGVGRERPSGPAVDLELEGGGLSALLELGRPRRGARSPARRSRSSWPSSADGPALLRGPGRAPARRARTGRAWPASRSPAGPPAARRLRRARGGLGRGEAGRGRDAGPSASSRRGPGRPPRAPRSPASSSRRGPSTGPELLKPETLGPLRRPAWPRSSRARARRASAAAVEEARAGPARGHARPPRRAREGRRARGLPARRVLLRARQPARRPHAAAGGAARSTRSSSRPRSTWERATPRRARTSTRSARGRRRSSARAGSPVLYALLGDALLRVEGGASRRSAILSEGLAAFPDDAAPAAAARHGLRDGGPRRGGPAPAHRVGGRAPGGPRARSSRRWPCSSRASRARRRERRRRRSGSASRATRRPTWTARARTARSIERWLRYLESRAGG